MIDIPQNNTKDTVKEKLISEVLTALNTKWTYSSYYASNNIPLSTAREVCRMFVEKGYHAEVVHFCDNRASYQSFHISKRPIDEAAGCMVWSELIG